MLPPGQIPRSDFPRFGLPPYAQRFPANISELKIDIELSGDGQEPFTLDLSSLDCPQTTQQADFHCVTTWSYCGADWGGSRFIDLYEQFIKPRESADHQMTGVVLTAQDGYKTSLLLEDLLGSDVLLATTLDGHALPVEHGAPIRLVAPAHYGYKNIKHLAKMEFYAQMPVIKRGYRAFLDHPRARVAKEERGRWVPGWILRYLYRPLINGTVKEFRSAMQRYPGDAPTLPVRIED